ncbi:hypothetical protein EDB86DRAFT_2906647 [Lactarius hatsudake]|nr:hypothetical protein EDB86DRAFT_2906647 [Lactarius hatsudake]
MLSLRFTTLYTSFALRCWADAMAQIGESSTGATPENYRETWSSTMRFSALHHILETQTQGDFATYLLNAQKAREAPRGHPW